MVLASMFVQGGLCVRQVMADFALEFYLGNMSLSMSHHPASEFVTKSTETTRFPVFSLLG